MSSALSMAIIIDEKCNIQCDHCCFSSGPKSTQHLSDEVIFGIIDQSAYVPELTTIGLSGGEAMLRQELVVAAVSRISQLGKHATLTTNAFWGVTYEKAEAASRRLKNAGLARMTISYDEFHTKFLSPERVQNVLRANRHLGIPTTINVAITNHDTGDAALAKLGVETIGVPITKFPVTPTGSANSLTEDSFIRTFDEPEALRCPGFEPTYHFDGSVYPCCSPSVFDTCLRIGDIKDTTVQKSVERIAQNAYFAIIRNEGFGWIFSMAKSMQILPDDMPTKFVDVCELCQIMTRTPNILVELAPKLIGHSAQLQKARRG